MKKYTTMSNKLDLILSHGSIVQDNSLSEDGSFSEDESFNFISKGFKYFLFKSHSNNDELDFVNYGQWCKSSKLFINNLYDCIKV